MTTDRITAAWLEGLGDKVRWHPPMKGRIGWRIKISGPLGHAECTFATKDKLLAVARALGVELGEGS